MEAGRAPANKMPDARKQQFFELTTTTYAHFNLSHLADIFAKEHTCFLSDETLRRWLPPGHRRPPRRGRHRRRPRRACEGELLFLDGSP
jgi:hypothetical protein